MKRIMRLFLRYVVALREKFTSPYSTQIVDEDLPENMKKRTLYVVQEDGFDEYAAMLCPCGCGRVLYMNMLRDERPCWHLIKHQDGTTSLRPSVWRKKDCKSHFWFRRGRVYWCHGGRPWWGYLFSAEIL